MIGDSNTFQIITHNSKYPFDHPEVIRRSFNKKYLHISEIKAKDEILVLSASDVTALYECFKTGIPMVTRMITVDGDTVLNPGNYIVPIGAPVSDVLESCKAQISSIKDILKGNPVSTETVSIDGHIQKDQSALIALSSQYVSYHPDDCISCGKCHLVCPMRLYPDILRESGKHSSECIGCGCCSYICPARLDFNSIYESEANKNE
jgi:electron transport complex protein RnfC